jgi:hypothetical protein
MGAFRAKGGRFEEPWRGVTMRRLGLNRGEAVGEVRRTPHHPSKSLRVGIMM